MTATIDRPAQPVSEVQAVMEEIHAACVADRSGAVADYIPELARVDPEFFGLSIAATTGEIFSVGDAQVEFTIQSISKAFVYCLALELFGRDEVLKRVGVEPSGDAFNAIVFDPATNRPFNPMVNAGAITVAAMIYEHARDEALDLLLDRFSKAAGRRLRVSQSVYRSEAETGHRNRAIAHLLRSAGAIIGDCEPGLDLYFQQCSILVTSADLAWMGATLGNVGRHPLSGAQVFSLPAVRDTLSLMLSCGMYDYSGNRIFDVGFPSKSGVGGGICGAINRQLGLGVYSPRLDVKGNSVRGVAAFRSLSDALGLHVFEWSNYGSQYLTALAG